MVVNAAVHVVALRFGIALLTRELSGVDHLPALLFFSLLLFGIPCGWENTLQAFQVRYSFVMLFSIACLWLTVTQEPFFPLVGRWFARCWRTFP